MTTFSDTVYSNGGVPAIGSGVPSTFGTYWFVDPDTNTPGTGKSIKRPFKYVGQAVAAAASNNHDVILMSGNSAINTSSTNDELALTKNRLHFVGMGGGSRYLGQRTRWTMGVTTGSAIAVVKNTGVGNTFTNIKFDSSDTLSTSLYAFADGGEYTQLTNCEVVKSTDLDQATSAVLLANGDSAYYKNCAFGSLVHIRTAAGTNVLTTRTTISGKVARDVIFEDCIFLLKSTSNTASQIHLTTATDVERMMIIKNSTFIHAVLGSATVAAAIVVDNTQTDGQVIVQDSYQFNHTALATASKGVYFAGSVIAATATAGDFIAVA